MLQNVAKASIGRRFPMLRIRRMNRRLGSRPRHWISVPCCHKANPLSTLEHGNGRSVVSGIGSTPPRGHAPPSRQAMRHTHSPAKSQSPVWRPHAQPNRHCGFERRGHYGARRRSMYWTSLPRARAERAIRNATQTSLSIHWLRCGALYAPAAEKPAVFFQEPSPRGPFATSKAEC